MFGKSDKQQSKQQQQEEPPAGYERIPGTDIWQRKVRRDVWAEQGIYGSGDTVYDSAKPAERKYSWER